MSSVGFETTISLFERVKTGHALELAATVIIIFWSIFRNVLNQFCFFRFCLLPWLQMLRWPRINWSGRKISWPILRYCPGIWLAGRGKVMKNGSFYNQCPGRDSNHVPPNMNLWSLTATPTCSTEYGHKKDEVDDKFEYNILRNVKRPTNHSVLNTVACTGVAMQWPRD
jgi:hypothetical protein